MRLQTKSKRAFTLVELLVVIAIIGILVGMLLPAVQSVREAARRAVCSNNLKQIALAIHNYESSHQIFPDGGLNWFTPRAVQGGVPRTAPNQTWGFLYQILPYIEEGNLYEETTNAVIQRTPVESYFCPSRRNSEVTGGIRAMNDFAGNGGLASAANGWSNGQVGGVIVRSQFTPAMKFSKITDGSSNTIMCGEKAVHPTHYRNFSCSDNEGYTSGWDWDTIRWGSRLPISDVQANACEVRFGSTHPGGLNMAFADASVHFISTSVDLTPWQNAISCDEGESSDILN